MLLFINIAVWILILKQFANDARLYWSIYDANITWKAAVFSFYKKVYKVEILGYPYIYALGVVSNILSESEGFDFAFHVR